MIRELGVSPKKRARKALFHSIPNRPIQDPFLKKVIDAGRGWHRARRNFKR